MVDSTERMKIKRPELPKPTYLQGSSNMVCGRQAGRQAGRHLISGPVLSIQAQKYSDLHVDNPGDFVATSISMSLK